ncbi:MAG: hypothetical protein M1814_005959 [Vezdaea aestivalis]|nr:MAG: hypothetical protein M1814_005959 [Vezdaea aestivalis]
MEPSASSKVTVEYFDPSGLFPSLAPELLPRLPLRNLNWKSPTRPIRSIDSLHIDLVPHGHQEVPSPSERTSRSQRESTADSGHSTESGSGALAESDLPPIEQKTVPYAGLGTLKGPLKERRHQIPGLRQTPYLKVYILRCDDNETYKSTSRKLLRDWIKEHAPQSQSSSSSKSDNHDAFEWLIIHAVLPGTAAAAQSRGGSAGNDSNAGGSSQEKSNAMRWASRNTSTVLEKIRSDFNSSSKTAPERVTQVRLLSVVKPTAPVPKSPVLSPDREGDWPELMARFKQLILRSFDTRVSQYEEDIREREQQRALPGWNFCTFFILKEGLARGFESVGLLEDARVSYDELSVGLDTVVREHISASSGEPQAGSFLPYTESLRRDLELARQDMQDIQSQGRDESGSESLEGSESDVKPPTISAARKKYRGLILANNISVFDFRCYIFARQMFLLLRMANGIIRTSSKSEGSFTRTSDIQASGENLAVLANVCERSVEYVSTTSRALRDDLWKGYLYAVEAPADGENGGPGVEAERAETSAIIGNMVASWTYSACHQVLEETYTKALPIPLLRGEGKRTSSLKEAPSAGGQHNQKLSISDSKVLSGGSKAQTLENQNRSSMQSVGELQSTTLSTRVLESPKEQFLKTGLESLAASRATLYLLARSAVSQSFTFKKAFKNIGISRSGSLKIGDGYEDVPLDSNSGKLNQDLNVHELVSIAGIVDPVLRKAWVFADQIMQFYEDLSERALRHYTVANRQVSAQRLMCDIAILRYNMEDYDTASTYFQRAIPFYTGYGWSQVDGPLLQAYAHCLQETEDSVGYIDVISRLLAEAIHKARSKLSRSRVSLDSTHEQYWLDLLNYGNNAEEQETLPLSQYFGDFELDTTISHAEWHDGFEMSMVIRHLLPVSFTAQKLRLRLVSSTPGVDEIIWLESADNIEICEGKTEVIMNSGIMVTGPFRPDRIEVCCQKLLFAHDCNTVDIHSIVHAPDSFNLITKMHTFQVYPRAKAMEVSIEWTQEIHLNKSRSILVHLSPGNNEIVEGQLRLKCGSAGLRLHTPEFDGLVGDRPKRKTARPGMFDFTDAPSEQGFTIRVPYTLERELAEINIKVELSYTTPSGSFSLKVGSIIPVVLPLGVNVRDIFKKDKLFSTFNVTAAISVPIRLLSSELESTEDFATKAGLAGDEEMLVFPNQSACLVYEIKPHQGESKRERSRPRPLELLLHYRCLDDELVALMDRAFDSSLKASPFKDLRMLLGPPLKELFRKQLSAHKLERYGLLGEFRLDDFTVEDLIGTVAVIALKRLDELRGWLKIWISEHTDLISAASTQFEEPLAFKDRQITIPVEIPRVQVVHTIDLQILSNSPNSSLIVPVGNALPAQLTIHSTRVWDLEAHNTAYAWPPPKPATSPSPHTAAGPPELEFILDVQADPEKWLVGGSKKRHFIAREGEIQTYPLTLMALQQGYLGLPNVDVNPVASGKHGAVEDGKDDDSIQQLGVTCEVDYRGHGEVVLAIPDRRSTTVGIISGTGTGGATATSHSGAWLMDSRGASGMTKLAGTS